MNTIIKSFEDALCDIRVRGIRISDSDKIDLDSQRKKIIEEYQRKTYKNLEKVPVATDLATKRTLILDSNKTCVALYRNYFQNPEKNIKIPLIEIRGEELESVIGDFIIINR